MTVYRYFKDGEPDVWTDSEGGYPEADGWQVEELDRFPLEGEIRVDGEWQCSPELESELLSRIDREAEAQRQQYLTPGSGQALEYREAVEEARAFADGQAGPFPMLQADVNAGTLDERTGQPVASIEQAADLVLFMHAEAKAPGAAIREARLAAKAAVRQATTAADKHAAAHVDWNALLT